MPLASNTSQNQINAHLLVSSGNMVAPAVGSILFDSSTKESCFRVMGNFLLPVMDNFNLTGQAAILVEALKSFPENVKLELEVLKKSWTCAVLTLSDKGLEGLREDKSGPALCEMLRIQFPEMQIYRYLLGDDAENLKNLLVNLALMQKISLVVTNGGTGLGPRDITPQTTASVIDYSLPGFVVAMLEKSLAKTPNAAISRSICGVLGKTLIVNVPGSLKGATENLAAILPALKHALDKLNGDTADCGG